MTQALSSHDKGVLIRIFDPEDLRDFENSQTENDNTPNEFPNVEYLE